MKVAFGKIDITPPEIALGEAAKIGMAGYGRNHYARGVLDPLMVHGVLIEDVILGNVKKRLLFISIDTLLVPLSVAEYIKKKIQERYRIAPSQVLVHATHTHSAQEISGMYHWVGYAPAIIWGIMFGLNRNDKYITWMAYRIRKMVGEMMQNLAPCKVAYTKKTVEEDVIINRRHPERRSKSPLGIIAFKNAENDELIGIMVNFTMHSTTLGSSNDKLSADYPGRLVARIEELTDGRVMAAFFGGAGGDINPIATCGTDFDHLTNNQILGQNGKKEDMERIGNFLGERALQVAQSIPQDDFYDRFGYESYVRTIWVPLRDFNHYYASSPMKSAIVKLQNRALYFAKKYIALQVVLAIAGNEDKEPTFPALAIKHRGRYMNCYSKLMYLMLHFSSSQSDKTLDVSIIGTPGEPFEDVGKYLIDRSLTSPENTIIFQHANDWMAYFFDLNEYTDSGGMESLEGTTPVAGYHLKKEYAAFLEDIKAGLSIGHY
nr:neutral/alkaline non-lysosomal ceramidase N-terminal domain-containing protein [Candidatus Sigynarchaeota archaeon]